MNRRHPVMVTLCQIVVHRHDMNALTSQGIQIGRKRGDECLSFTRLHLRNTPLMENDSTNDLYAVWLKANHSFSCFPDSCECLRQKLIKRLPILITVPVLIRLGLQLSI